MLLFGGQPMQAQAHKKDVGEGSAVVQQPDLADSLTEHLTKGHIFRGPTPVLDSRHQAAATAA